MGSPSHWEIVHQLHVDQTKAAEHFDKALSLDATYSQAALYLGRAYNSLFDQTKAEAAFRKAHTDLPMDRSLHERRDILTEARTRLRSNAKPSAAFSPPSSVRQQKAATVFQKIRPGVRAHRGADSLRGQHFEEQRAGNAAVDDVHRAYALAHRLQRGR